MITIERKLNHINTMKKTIAELNRRIAAMEKEIERDMLAEYAAVNTATTN